MEGMEEEGRSKNVVEDTNGYERRGTVWTATAHCITAVIGSGVLALGWSVAQLGWIMGPISLLGFSSITYYTSTLLADCYRCPDPVTGSRNHTYMDAVKSYLGPKNVLVCFIAQHANLWGAMVSYTITSAISMRAIMQSYCFRIHRQTNCAGSEKSFMILFGVISVMLSQFPNLEKITWLSVVAAVMSFGYSIISFCLCLAKWIAHGDFKGALMGVMAREDGLSSIGKTWRVFQALGNIAFAFTYAEVLIEIQDTLKSTPSENVTMKRASLYGVGTTTIFYIAIGCVAYTAFGNDVPGNILTGFLDPFWLVDIANLFIIIHLLGAYQVFAQPIFATMERKLASKWPNASFIHTTYTVRIPFTKKRSFNCTPTKIILRSILIIFTTLISMLLPFFNAIMGLLGAMSFWPLTVYLPVNMALSQRKIKKGMLQWFLLHGLCIACLLLSLAVTLGSTVEIVNSLRHAKPFSLEY